MPVLLPCDVWVLASGSYARVRDMRTGAGSERQVIFGGDMPVRATGGLSSSGSGCKPPAARRVEVTRRTRAVLRETKECTS